jgi:hypothetical protein
VSSCLRSVLSQAWRGCWSIAAKPMRSVGTGARSARHFPRAFLRSILASELTIVAARLGLNLVSSPSERLALVER